MGISKKSWTAFVVESVPGTAILVPTKFHPTVSKWTQQKKFIYLSENRGSRDANTQRKASVRSGQGDISGSFYLDTSPYLLYGFMGADAPTQPDSVNAPGAWSHALTLVDTPPSLTVLKGYDVAGFYAAFSVVESLKYTWAADNKLLEEQATIQSRYMQKLTATQFAAVGSPVYSAPTPGLGALLAGYMPTIKLSGVASTVIEDVEIDLSQKITLFYAINGSQDQVRVYFGDRSANINFTASFDDTGVYDRYDQELDDQFEVEFLGQYMSNMQTVAIPVGSTAGNFTLTVVNTKTGVSATTGNIAWNATATVVQTALQALTTVGLGASQVAVTGGPGPATAWIVKFIGSAQNIAFTVTGVGTGLTPSGAVTVTPAAVRERVYFNFPIVGWDDMNLDVSKDFIELAAKGTARPGTSLNSTFTANVVNSIASYVS